MKALVLLALACAACNGARSARYRHTTPPPLPAAATPLDPGEVLVSFAPFTWQATAGTSASYRVMLSTVTGGPRAGGDHVGEVRTPDVPVPDDVRAALYCAWGPGKHDDCSADPEDARPLLLRAVTSLRDEAARAGANQVRDARCFVREALLWCEGTAYAGELGIWRDAPREPALLPRADPAPSRWRIAATMTGGRYGDELVLGTTLDVTYRSVRVAFHMVSPPSHDKAGLGLDLLYRRRLRDRFHALGGITTMALVGLAQDGEASAGRGAIGPVLGLGWEAKDVAFFDGFGKPFAELRLGWLAAKRAREGKDLAGLGVELLVGFTTP